MSETILQNLIRPVNPETDVDLPVFSYSKLEVYKNCPFQYNLKYNQEKRTEDTSIALDLGSLCHYVLEQKGKALAAQETVDYTLLNSILQNGVEELDEKTKERIPGVQDIKHTYFEIFYQPDNASGMTYVEKLQIFDKVLHKEMEDDDWIPKYFEHPFSFVWRDKYVISGFIDRIDEKEGNLRTVDYKTSKKVYEQSKLATSLQFGIYALAILNDFGKLPIESKYRFILIDQSQYALTKGWEERLIKALDKLFEEIEGNENSGVWAPKPTPLCHWCNYCEHNPDANDYKHECEYFSLWTPTNKTFKTNKIFNPSENLQKLEKRKIVF